MFFFSKKSLSSFLSLRYSADFRRSRLVDYYHSLVFGGKCFKRHFSCGRESYSNLDGISAGFLLRLKINSSLNMGGSFIRTSISEKLKAGISFAMGFRGCHPLTCQNSNKNNKCQNGMNRKPKLTI